MGVPRATTPASLSATMWCSAVLSAQFIAGKAARDAIFLANNDVTALPLMIAAAAGFSILLVMLNSQLLRRMAPATLIPFLSVITGVSLLVAWGLLTWAPRVA